jgi:hypothetical protein
VLVAVERLAWSCPAIARHACLHALLPFPACIASTHSLSLPCLPTLPYPHTAQIVTFIQTVVIGFLLAWLYSDMSQTAAGIQDEIG